MATLALLNHQLETRGVYDSFWQFILSNETGVIGTAAGVTLGIATAALAFVIVTGFIVPALAYTTTAPLKMISKKWSGRITSIVYGKAHPEFQFAHVWNMLLLWILVVIIVFVIIEGLRKVAIRQQTDMKTKTSN